MEVTTRIPRPPSEGEEHFARDLRAYGYKFEREVAFHPKRKWRVDFVVQADKQVRVGPAYSSQWRGVVHRLAVEIEGIIPGEGGRHQRFASFEKDLEKYAEIVLAGYPLLRFTPRQVKKGFAIQCVNRYFGKAA